MLAFAVAPAVIFAVADGLRRYHRAVDDRDRMLRSEAIVDAQETRDLFVGLRAVAETLARNPDVAGFAEPRCSQLMAATVAGDAAYRLAVAMDGSGVARCASRTLSGPVSFADDADFRDIAASPRFNLAVRVAGRISGESVLIGSAPIMAQGRFAGAVSISVAASSLRFLAPDAAGDDDGAPRPLRAIVAAEGETLLNSDDAADAAGWLPPDIAAHLATGDLEFTAPDSQGARRAYALASFVEGRAWLLAGSQPLRLVDEAILAALPGIVTPLIMLVVAVAVAYLALDRLVARHLVGLARITRAYGRGRLRLRPRLAANAPEEIAILAQSLGDMAESLAAREGELRDSAETNRVLLLEVYHRVRNNLQMMASLMNLQLRRTRDAEGRATLASVRSRIHSLALVHDKLYVSDAVDRLDLARLLGDVARSVVEPQGPGSGQLALHLDLAARIETPERATPLALFLNEALLDAVARAGGTAAEGAVTVALRDRPDGGLSLAVVLDRPGGAARAAEDALGHRLMEGFARQLRAEFTVDAHDGLHRIRLAAPGRAAAAAA